MENKTDYAACLKNTVISLLSKYIKLISWGVFLCVFIQWMQVLYKLPEWNVLLSCPIKNDNKLPHFTSESSVYNAWLLQNAFGNLAYGVTCVKNSK